MDLMRDSRTRPALLVAAGRDDTRRLLSAVAVSQGFNVTRASSGSEAIEILATTSFEVVVLDAALPHVSSDDVLTYYEARYPALHNVILASDNGAAAGGSSRHGVFAVISSGMDITTIAGLMIDCARGLRAA
jgi:DNA-binding NtrC family response regulator